MTVIRLNEGMSGGGGGGGEREGETDVCKRKEILITVVLTCTEIGLFKARKMTKWHHS